jgi:hypothetical protein
MNTLTIPRTSKYAHVFTERKELSVCVEGEIVGTFIPIEEADDYLTPEEEGNLVRRAIEASKNMASPEQVKQTLDRFRYA